MSLTQQERAFINKTKAYFKSLANKLPTAEELAEKGIIQKNFLSLAGKIHRIENDEERAREEQNFNSIWNEFFNIQRKLLDAKKPQDLLFGNSKPSKKKQNPHIEIEHPTNVLAELKNGYNGVLNLGEDVGDAILEAGGVVKKGAKVAGSGAMKGAKVAGSGIMKGAKVAGKGVMKGAKVAGVGVAAVGAGIGAGIVSGANFAWDNVLSPFKDSIVDLTQSTINKIEDYIRAENLQDANVQLAYVRDNATNVLESALYNALSIVKILHPEIETEAKIEEKAKDLINYAKLEIALKDLDHRINSNFLNQPEQLKTYLQTLSEQVKDVQEAVASVTTACAEITNQAEQHLIVDVTEKQNNKWLSKPFVAFKSKHNFLQDITSLRGVVATEPQFDSWTEHNKELYLETQSHINTMFNQAIAICTDNPMYGHHLQELDEVKKQLTELSEDPDIAENLNLLENMLEKISELDVAQHAYAQNNELMLELEKAKQKLVDINIHKDNTDTFVRKMQKGVIGIMDPKKGLARLSSKKLSSLSKFVTNLMQDIWTSASDFIKKSPSLADKLLNCATSAMSTINKAWDTFTRKFYKFIGVKKTKENPECIYQHKGFSPKLVKKLINEKFVVAPDNMFDKNSYVYPDVIKKRARYPYNIKIKLECTKKDSNDKKIIEVPIMEFYQHGIEISPFPSIDLIPKNYQVPGSELAKFEQAQQQLVAIITHDKNGLSGVRTSKNIVLHGFDDDHFGAIMKGSPFVEEQKDKLGWQGCKFSPELEQELKTDHRRQHAVSENPIPAAFPRRG